MTFTHLAEPMPITEQDWPEGTIPLVSIDCVTYNHEKYISDAIEGFLMQKTTFPVEILIHDDASTDGTADIVRSYEYKYPRIIRPLYQKKNQYSELGCQGLWEIQRRRHKGKYVAFCEGDDYWTDPYKLQKQVIFLETNPDYGMIHTDYNEYNVKNNKYLEQVNLQTGYMNQSGDIYEHLFSNRAFVHTCTVCCRKCLLDTMKQIDFSNYNCSDIPTWLYIAAKSKVGYLSESTAARNVLPISITQGRSFEHKYDAVRSNERIFLDFQNIKPVSEETRTLFYQKLHKLGCSICYEYRMNYKAYKHHMDHLQFSLKLWVKYWLIRLCVPRLITDMLYRLLRQRQALNG